MNAIDKLKMGEFQNYIDKGGVIFTILLVMSAIGTTIIFYKFIELYLFNDDKLLNCDELLDQSKNLSDFKEHLIGLEKSNFLSKVLTVLEKKSPADNDEISNLIEKEIEKSQKLMPTLEIIAQVSPLIGLLGTVIGMIDSFNELELGGSLVDPSILAGGIWTALLTTAMGLIVAIPALISHYFFDRKIMQKYKRTETVVFRIKNIA